MSLENFVTKFYLDKEKDIVVNLFRSERPDELIYILGTPNHHTGNLITNLAKVANVETVKNENDMKIITGVLQACINDDGEEVYIFRLGGIKIANIYPDGRIERKAKIPAIIKLLMAQTKDYRLPIEKTIVKSYILKKSKFRTDLHTHLNQILQPDLLIALGIKHQMGYSLYYIKKLNLKITAKQEKEILTKRKEVEKRYKHSDLTGKALERKINDETQINMADLILNNLSNAEENIVKIRNSLVLLKDGQAVFTNLEKTLLYRYAIIRGKQVPENEKIDLNLEKIEKITDCDIRTLFTAEQLKECPAIIKALSKSPYVVGMDLIGEEINNVTDFSDIIEEIIKYAIYEDEGYTIRLHAGETDAFKDNIEKALECIKICVPNGEKAPQVRLGHGLYVPDLNSKEGKRIINKMKDLNEVEEEILAKRKIYFEEKSKKFEEFLDGRTIREAFLEEEENNLANIDLEAVDTRGVNNLNSYTVFKDRITNLPQDKMPIIIAGGSFNSKDRITTLNEETKKSLKELLEKVDNKNTYILIGHKVQGYERAVLDISKELNKKFDVTAVVPKYISEDIKENLDNSQDLNGIYVSPDPSELGIYKSFNYEIFERRNSVVVAFDGNSPVSNLIQEAKNGKGKAKIYVNSDVELLKEKAKSLDGYVRLFNSNCSLAKEILEDNPEIKEV